MAVKMLISEMQMNLDYGRCEKNLVCEKFQQNSVIKHFSFFSKVVFDKIFYLNLTWTVGK